MKIKKEHYAVMKKAITKVIAEHPEAYNEYKVKGLSDMRYRWDCLWAAKISDWIQDTLYPYANDDHINTALRSITGAKENPERNLL